MRLGPVNLLGKKKISHLSDFPVPEKHILSIALGIKAIEQGYTVLFSTLSEMMEDLYMSRADNSFRQKLKKYVSPDLLIIDEFGLKNLGRQMWMIFTK